MRGGVVQLTPAPLLWPLQCRLVAWHRRFACTFSDALPDVVCPLAAAGTYQAALRRSFLRTLDDGHHAVVVLDAPNLKAADYQDLLPAAQAAGYQPYLLACPDADPEVSFIACGCGEFSGVCIGGILVHLPDAWAGVSSLPLPLLSPAWWGHPPSFSCLSRRLAWKYGSEWCRTCCTCAQACHGRNIHGRSLEAIKAAAAAFEPSPSTAPHLDVANLLFEPHGTQQQGSAGRSAALGQAGGEAAGAAAAGTSRWALAGEGGSQRGGAAGGAGRKRGRGAAGGSFGDDDDSCLLKDVSAALGAGAGDAGGVGRSRKRVRWPDLEPPPEGFTVGPPPALEQVCNADGLAPALLCMWCCRPG